MSNLFLEKLCHESITHWVATITLVQEMFFTYYKTLISSCISVSSLFARLHFEVLWSVTASNETVEAEIFVFFIYFLIGSANIGEATSQSSAIYEVHICTGVQFLLRFFIEMRFKVDLKLFLSCFEMRGSDHFADFFGL